MTELKKIRAIVADMDGVLWRDYQPVRGAAEFFQAIHGQIPYVFATNNSSKTVEYYVETLNRLGIPADASQIITSSIATAAYLSRRYPPHTHVFVVGEIGLKSALQAQGFVVTEGFKNPPQVVVAGIDRGFNYQKLQQAAGYIRQGALFVGTNGDKTFPGMGGLVPGAGSILAAIAAASDVEPLIIGKPDTPMFEIALARLGSSPAETLMLGDRLDTDILGAGAVGMKTALMLSGVSTEADIIESNIQPDFVFDDLAELWLAYG